MNVQQIAGWFAAVAVVVGVASAGLLVSNNALAVTGTVHDLSGRAWNTTGEICEVCHTPHHGKPVVDGVLWNHKLTTVDPYILYASASLDAVVGQPSGTTRLCLSCHDGTVAVDAYGPNAGGAEWMWGGGRIGTDLSRHHPVSFIFDDTLAADDGQLHPPSTTPSGLGGTIQAKMLSGVLNNKLECATCHDPHDAAYSNFLRMSNSGSALCLLCHDK